MRRLDCADLGRKPEEHGDDVVGGGETPFLGERCDVAVTDGGDGDEGVVDGVEERGGNRDIRRRTRRERVRRR